VANKVYTSHLITYLSTASVNTKQVVCEQNYWPFYSTFIKYVF